MGLPRGSSLLNMGADSANLPGHCLCISHGSWNSTGQAVRTEDGWNMGDVENRLDPGCVAQWVGAFPMHQRVAGAIPGQRTYLGVGIDPWLGCVRETPKPRFSLTLMFPPAPLSFSSMETCPWVRIKIKEEAGPHKSQLECLKDKPNP